MSATPCLHRNASQGLRGHRSFAVCRLEAILRQSITNSDRCCRQTPLPIPQPRVSSLDPSHVLLTQCSLQPYSAPDPSTPRCQGEDKGSVYVQGHCVAGSCPCLHRNVYPPATPSPRPSGATAAPSSAPSPCPRRRLGTKHPAPASKYHAVTAVIWYCAGVGALPAWLPRLPTSCSTQAATGAPWPASCPEILSPPGGTTALQPAAPGSLRPRGEAGRQRQPSGSERGS